MLFFIHAVSQTPFIWLIKLSPLLSAGSDWCTGSPKDGTTIGQNKETNSSQINVDSIICMRSLSHIFPFIFGWFWVLWLFLDIKRSHESCRGKREKAWQRE